MQKHKKSFIRLATQLHIASEPNRLHILCLLFEKRKMCVSDISKKLKLSIAVTSHHLQALTKEELLISKRDGKQIHYILPSTEFIEDFKKLICKYKDI